MEIKRCAYSLDSKDWRGILCQCTWFGLNWSVKVEVQEACVCVMWLLQMQCVQWDKVCSSSIIFVAVSVYIMSLKCFQKHENLDNSKVTENTNRMCINCSVSVFNAAFTCYWNYRKYELPSQKLDMNGLSEALYGKFTIIPIARECSIMLIVNQPIFGHLRLLVLTD